MDQPRILILDDQPSMLRSVERVLGDKYEVRGLTAPRQALGLAREFSPHIAILDVQMPEMDGFEVMGQLKQYDPDMQVILMTGSLYGTDEKLIRAIREKAFYFIIKPFDREVLRTLVQRCLELRFLEDANRRHTAHLESQLAEARAFQQTMLPSREAEIGGLAICAEYRPCAELAGDLYDYAPAGDGRVALLVADVAGHGVSAAMLTGIVKSAFHASHMDDYAPAAVVRRVAEGLASFDAHRFVTLIAARISPGKSSLEFVNAGHEGGLLLRSGQSSISLEATGPIVSPAFAHLGWEMQSVEWKPGSRAVLFTDGIPEATHGEEAFGVERLKHIVEGSSGSPRTLLDSIMREVQEFSKGRPPADDMTLLMLGCGQSERSGD
jgi:sigma-B regulation protein RsbU (phosphoserine phosphatase)